MSLQITQELGDIEVGRDKAAPFPACLCPQRFAYAGLRAATQRGEGQVVSGEDARVNPDYTVQ